MISLGHLTGLQLLITSNKALTILTYNFVWDIPSFLWASVVGQYNSVIFSFFSDYQNVFWVSVPFYTPTNNIVIFFHILPALCVYHHGLYFFRHDDSCMVASHYLSHGFCWVPQMLMIVIEMAGARHIFFNEISLYVLSMLWIDFVCFCCCALRVLCLFWSLVLCQTWGLEVIFSHSTACVIILLDEKATILNFDAVLRILFWCQIRSRTSLLSPRS